jgi:hypothetical protein
LLMPIAPTHVAHTTAISAQKGTMGTDRGSTTYNKILGATHTQELLSEELKS